jgi:hypothetical protein
MSWQVGDLAVCVDDAPCPCCGQQQAVRKGNIYTVSEVSLQPESEDYEEVVYLRLAEIPPQRGISHGHLNEVDCECFRKVVRDKHEACENEFVTLLKRTKVRA